MTAWLRCEPSGSGDGPGDDPPSDESHRHDGLEVLCRSAVSGGSALRCLGHGLSLLGILLLRATREFARIWTATPRFVFSTSLIAVEGNSRLVRGDVGDVLEQVRTEFDGDVEVGGANLAAQSSGAGSSTSTGCSSTRSYRCGHALLPASAVAAPPRAEGNPQVRIGRDVPGVSGEARVRTLGPTLGI